MGKYSTRYDTLKISTLGNSIIDIAPSNYASNYGIRSSLGMQKFEDDRNTCLDT